MASAPHPPPSRTRGLLALLLGAAFIGLAPAWVRWSEVGPVATAFHRLLLALPFLAAWAARERRLAAATATATATADSTAATRPLASRNLRLWAAAGGACFALDLAAWHLSIRLTSVANATLLANLAPIFVTLGAWFFLRERVPASFFAALAVSLAGAWLLTGASPGGGTPEQRHGDLLALVTALFYGGYQLCIARLRRSLGTAQSLFWSSLVSTPVLGLLALAHHESILPTTPRAWLVLAGLALTAQILGQGLITFGFAHLPAGYSSLTLLVQPLVAAALGWIAFHEPLAPLQALGASLLVAGLLLARNPRPASHSRHPPHEPGTSAPR